MGVCADKEDEGRMAWRKPGILFTLRGTMREWTHKKRMAGLISVCLLLLLVHAPALLADEIIGYIEEAFEAHINDDFKTAITFYTKAIETGKLPKDDLAVVHNLRGEAWADNGDCRNAVLDFTQAIRLRADYAHAFYFRSICYQEMGDYRKAWQDIEKAVFFNPNKVLYREARALLEALMED
jgi:tetratricopeptide (TPR) repeat protein